MLWENSREPIIPSLLNPVLSGYCGGGAYHIFLHLWLHYKVVRKIVKIKSNARFTTVSLKALSGQVQQQDINNFVFESCLFSFVITFSTARKQTGIIIIKLITLENRQYLSHNWSDKGFKGDLMLIWHYQVCSEGSHKITLTVPLIYKNRGMNPWLKI